MADEHNPRAGRDLDDEIQGDWETDLRRLMPEPSSSPSLDIEAVLRFAEDELDENEADELRLKLPGDADAVDFLLDYEDFKSSLEESKSKTNQDLGPFSDRAIADGVERVLNRIGPDTAVPSKHGWWQLAAAAFALVAIGLAVIAYQQTRRLASLREGFAQGGVEVRSGSGEPGPVQVAGTWHGPQTGVPILDVFTGERSRGPESEAVELRLPKQAQVWMLILTPESLAEAAQAELRVADEDGRELWRGPVVPDPSGAIVAAFPRAMVGPGKYRLALHQDGVATDEFALLILDGP